MRSLFPAIEPHTTHSLPVHRHHHLYVEECGNPAGLPVIFLHGGPGSGCRPYHRRFFNPDVYRIVLLDQRGAGRSIPCGLLRQNTTSELVADIDIVRRHLGIDRWVLFGGSWGATLALLYAQRHPRQVAAMILRGSFLARRRDLEWYLLSGANRIYPERWASLMRFADGKGIAPILKSFDEILHGQDELMKLRFAKAWTAWGAQLTLGDDFDIDELEDKSSGSLLRQIGIELHYARRRYFLRENQVLDQCVNLPKVPTLIVHGRHDFVCPPDAALTLHQHIPGAELRIVPKAGHAAASPAMVDALVAATDEIPAKLTP